VIYVTVGTHTAQFDRLVRAADAYARTTSEEVVVQRGASAAKTTAARSFDFCDSEEMDRLIRGSRIVVCHGADTILDVLRAGKPVVAVPRQKRYGEHLNDHQVDFAQALAERGWIAVLDDPENGLADAIERAATRTIPSVPDEPRLAIAIRELLTDWFPDRQPTRSR
jgi:exopolysaccharide biosynthesis glucuronosyltransferase PssE